MAQQTTVILTDDIDGGKAVETVSFGLDGKHYEIDLGAKNAKNLRKAVAVYVEAGRKVKANTAARSNTKTVTSSDGSDLAAIRAWAHENGIQVAARGRIASSVKEQYLAATAG
ncbi:histone-like nucleoid-structuring protein Lsr2 [Nakamurella sp. GG22]